MDDDILPHNLLVGAQLAVGVQGSSMYITNEPENAKNGTWLRYCEESLPFSLNKLRIGNGVTILEEPSDSFVSDVNRLKASNDEVFGEEEEMELTEHLKNTIVKDLKWERLSPVIPSNLQIFREVAFSEDHMYDVRNISPALQRDYVPEELITGLTHSDYVEGAKTRQARKTEKLLVFDPIINELFVVGHIQTTADLRNNNDQQLIIAYTSGETNSCLKVTIIPKDKLHLKNNTEWLRSLFRNKQKDTGDFEVNFKSSIKSLKIPNVSTLLGRSGDTIGVLTETALCFLRIDNIDLQTYEISHSAYEPLQFSSFGDFPFADFAFNPWDLQQFAIVDIRGNWGVGRLLRSHKTGNKLRLLPDVRGSIFDAEELSSWKRIEWSSTYSRLLLIDSSKIIEIDYEKNWQLEVVQAKTWSCLRDYKRIDDDFGILLTSREIVIVGTRKTNEQITRLVSWKHSLDTNDQTLRLSAQKISINSKFLILSCVFSRGHNKVYLHGFIYDQDRSLLQSVKGPVIQRMPNVEKGIHSLNFLPCVEDNTSFGSETLIHDLCLHLFVKENKADKLLHFFLTTLDSSTAEVRPLNIPSVMSQASITRDITVGLKPNAIVKSFIERYKAASRSVGNKELLTVRDNEILQKFGYHLSEVINEVVISWESGAQNLKLTQPLLRDLSTFPTTNDSIEELESLLDQLAEYYQDVGVTFTNFATTSNLLLQEEIQNFDIFYSKLLQCWDMVTPYSQQMTREVFENIMWSTLRFHKLGNYQKIENELQESMSERNNEIIRLWDDDELNILGHDEPEDNFLQQSSQPQFLFNSQSQIPTIKSSQPKVAKRVRHPHPSQTPSSQNLSFSQTEQNLPSSRTYPDSNRELLPNTMAPAFTLMSPPAPSLSQSQNSQRTKRKKKRIGGFG